MLKLLVRILRDAINDILKRNGDLIDRLFDIDAQFVQQKCNEHRLQFTFTWKPNAKLVKDVRLTLFVSLAPLNF